MLKGYPRLSETFIAQEILNLENADFDITLFSLRQPTDTSVHSVHEKIVAEVNYLPEYLYQQPFRVFRAWLSTRRRPGYQHAFRQWWRDLKRDRTANRIRRFGQALVLAAELPDEIRKLYAHFLHTPASVTYYASQVTGLPWACSAHAKDIWTSPDWEIQEKLQHCKWLTTCTANNVKHLSGLTSDTAKVSLNYHGLDLARFSDFERTYSAACGTENEPVTLLSVGRAVEKKGYRELLRALSQLPDDLQWAFEHIGGGPQLDDLSKQAESLNIADRIVWHGSASQDIVIDAYRRADFFVLNSRIDASGDRDGLPNVLVEAQCTGLAVVSTRLSGIPELIANGENGLLVEPDDTSALRTAILELIYDPSLRERLGRTGTARVTADFDMHSNIEKLVGQLRSLA